MNELKRLRITPIADLCHFGVPDWVGGFHNPDWPALFADYARAFARRYNWVRLYTPVNEIFISARFSAKLGWWNERLASDRAFVTALKNATRANILAEEAILEEQPEAWFIQSESTEYFHALEPAALGRAGFFNELRFLSLDLCYGRDTSAGAFQYLTDHGMTTWSPATTR
jgi:beta-glucosidase/6-phospho-beta-glucosidase/beta-galactosidase